MLYYQAFLYHIQLRLYLFLFFRHLYQILFLFLIAISSDIFDIQYLSHNPKVLSHLILVLLLFLEQIVLHILVFERSFESSSLQLSFQHMDLLLIQPLLFFYFQLHLFHLVVLLPIHYKLLRVI